MEQDQPYLSTKDLAERYGITERTIKKWRTSTRRGKAEGPQWYDVPRQATAWVNHSFGMPFPKYLLGKKQTQLFLLKSF